MDIDFYSYMGDAGTMVLAAHTCALAPELGLPIADSSSTRRSCHVDA